MESTALETHHDPQINRNPLWIYDKKKSFRRWRGRGGLTQFPAIDTNVIPRDLMKPLNDRRAHQNGKAARDSWCVVRAVCVVWSFFVQKLKERDGEIRF
jgi:hypothetical protein